MPRKYECAASIFCKSLIFGSVPFECCQFNFTTKHAENAEKQKENKENSAHSMY
jgi:hypothetical protein